MRHAATAQCFTCVYIDGRLFIQFDNHDSWLSWHSEEDYIVSLPQGNFIIFGWANSFIVGTELPPFLRRKCGAWINYFKMTSWLINKKRRNKLVLLSRNKIRFLAHNAKPLTPENRILLLLNPKFLRIFIFKKTFNIPNEILFTFHWILLDLKTEEPSDHSSIWNAREREYEPHLRQ